MMISSEKFEGGSPMVRILEWDSALRPFERDINLRMDNYKRMRYC